MLTIFKNLLDTITPNSEDQASAESDERIRLACAVLLIEVARVDTQIDTLERTAIGMALRQRFMLTEDALARLIELAEKTAKSSYDYQHFTSSLNDHFSQDQKIGVVQAMWQVAYADKHLDANENHVISKVAGLLYVTHGEYIGAKMRAKEAAQSA